MCLSSIYRIFHINQAVPLFMLVSGYVFTLSYKNNKVTTLKSCYNLDILNKRIKRLYVPFLAFYSVELLSYKILSSNNLDVFFIIKNLILGGIGPGSYYPVVMFQFLLLFPIIYIVTYRKLDHSIPIFFILGVLFEFFTYISGMDEWIYRLLIGRYLFVIALGSYLAQKQNKINKKLLYVGATLSIVYMYASVYLGYYVFGHNFWYPHQAPAYFYTALLFVVGMNYLPEKPGIVFKLISEFGKASWHIFLIQMGYFMKIGLHSDSIFAIVVNLIFCIIIGYMFYLFENNIQSRGVLKKKHELLQD